MNHATILQIADVVVKNYVIIPIHFIAPTPVNCPTANAINFSSILVTWSRPTFPNGPITYYNVYYREGNTTQIQEISDVNFKSVTTSNTATSINVTGLKPYTNYTIHVRAIISAETLQNIEQFTEDLFGAADVEIVQRTNGTTPVDLVMLDDPLSEPSSSTIEIQVPDARLIETGRVL